MEKMIKRKLCSWCVQGLSSHGIKIYSGEYLGEGVCEECKDVDNLLECIEEVEDYKQ